MPTVVDDEASIRETLTIILEAEGHEVSVAAHGREAARFFTDDLDLVVTDLLMPECDGLETIRVLRTRHPEVKVIAISGGGTIDAALYLGLAIKMGAKCVLQKPVAREVLLAAIADALGFGSSSRA